MTADADAALVLRALASQGGVLEPRYHIALPQLLALSPGDVLSGLPRNSVRIVKEGRVEPAASASWQRPQVVADLKEVTVTLNDTEIGIYELESFAGYIFFTSKKGHLQIRNIVAKDAESTFTTPAKMLTAKDVLAAGGTAPKLRRQVRPFYSIEALHQRKISGVVWMDAVVLPDGTVGSVRVTRPLDPDLNQSAVASVRRWGFTPGMLNGFAVPVLIEVEMSFAITQ